MSSEAHRMDKDGIELLDAAKEGRKSAVKLLLAKKSLDPNVQDKNGRTPLSWAAKRGYSRIVKLLLKSDNVDINLTDDYDQTPLLWAEIGRASCRERV